MTLPPGCLVAVGLKAEGALLPKGTRIVCAGGNPARLAAALEAAPGPIAAVLSFGIAGGLDPELRTGDLVVASRVRGPSGAYSADHDWAMRLAAATGARVGTLAGAAEVAGTPGEKARLRAMTGALAVDLESEAAAAFAARRGLPFAALRAIADEAGSVLPRAAAVGLNPDGSPAPGRVLLALLRRPGELGALLKVARDSGSAMRALRGALT